MSTLACLMERGGIFYHLPGKNPRETIENLADRIALPPQVARDALVRAVLEREELVPTSHGFGIALPHPRFPVSEEPDAEFVAIGVLENPVDWRALDGEPVFAACLIASASARNHLKTLSRLNYFCCDLEFRRLLRENAPAPSILSFISDAEKSWK